MASSPETRDLRGRAESVVPGPQDRDEFELDVARAELELQNEELREAHSRLMDSRDEWQSLYDLAPVAYVTLDERGLILSANSSACDLLSAAQLTGRPLAAFVDPSMADNLHLHLRAARSVGARVECELRINGKEVRVTSTVRSDGRGLTALVDITERRKAERETTRNQARLATILQTAPDAILTVDSSGRVADANGASERMFGLQASELVGKDLTRLIDEVREAKETRYDTFGRRRNMSAFPIEVRAGDIEVAGEKLRVLFLRDVTELRDYALRLDEALTRFRLVADHIEDVLYLLDAATLETLYSSPASQLVYGRAPRLGIDEYLGWVHADDRQWVERALENSRRGDPFDLEYRLLRPDGVMVVIHDRAFPEPELGLVMGIARDVTDERRLEEQLNRAQKLEAVGTLSAGIAHDFNNLLMGIAGCAKIARRRIETEHPAQRSVALILEACSRGSSLTRQLLDSTGRRSTNPAPTDIDRTIDNMRSTLGSMVRRDVDIDFSLQAAVRVLAGVGEVEQVLINLVKNAQDAMPSGGDLRVSTRVVTLDDRRAALLNLTAGRYVALKVEDDGVGMSAETRRRAFEPFFTTKALGSGTGLGLATTFGIVRRLNGDIQVESSPGAGASFTIHLPITERAELSTADIVLPPAAKGLILVVEDERLVRMATRDCLEEIGFEVITAEGARGAMRILEAMAREIDAVLVDVVMPEVGGDQLAMAIRTRFPDVRIVFMSAHDKVYLTEQGRLGPDDPLVEKPFEPAEIAAALLR